MNSTAWGRRYRRTFAPLAAAIVAMLAEPAVSGADEGERVLSAYGGLSGFAASVGADNDQTASGIGGGIGIDYERGLTRSVWFRASAGGALFSGRPTSASGHATVGITYMFDVLKVVPYGHIGVGGVALYLDRAPDANDADNGTEFHPLVELGLGVDFLSKGDLSWGPHVRFESFIDRTALFVAGIRGSYRWGFF